ncbi:hypothetical protein LY78DRAFT_657228 [Colletotrichum sublineola]|nr:hypothetical protein LY78DRAFT_657228 [Colletotrichum sublineola]
MTYPHVPVLGTCGYSRYSARSRNIPELGKALASLSSNDATSVTWRTGPVDNHHRPPRTSQRLWRPSPTFPSTTSSPRPLRLVVVSTVVRLLVKHAALQQCNNYAGWCVQRATGPTRQYANLTIAIGEHVLHAHHDTQDAIWHRWLRHSLLWCLIWAVEASV